VLCGSVQTKRRAGDGFSQHIGASVGEETMKETTAAEINVVGRLRWVAAAMINLGARDPAVSNGYTCESSSAKEK
jgi:hypothetical protein